MKESDTLRVIKALKGDILLCFGSNILVICRGVSMIFLMCLNSWAHLVVLFWEVIEEDRHWGVCVGRRAVLKTAELFFTSCPQFSVMPRWDVSNQLPHTTYHHRTVHSHAFPANIGHSPLNCEPNENSLHLKKKGGGKNKKEEASVAKCLLWKTEDMISDL